MGNNIETNENMPRIIVSDLAVIIERWKIMYIALRTMYKVIKMEIKILNQTFITSVDVKMCLEFLNCFHLKKCI